MSFNVGHITGGTHSRCRTVKQAHGVWRCMCLDPVTDDGKYIVVRSNPGWRGKCDSCGAKRPT